LSDQPEQIDSLTPRKFKKWLRSAFREMAIASSSARFHTIQKNGDVVVIGYQEQLDALYKMFLVMLKNQGFEIELFRGGAAHVINGDSVAVLGHPMPYGDLSHFTIEAY